MTEPVIDIRGTYNEKEKGLVRKALEIHYSLGYFLNWKVERPIMVMWGNNYRYVIYIADNMNTRLLHHYDIIPDYHELGKIVVTPYGKKLLKVEVNFREVTQK